MENKTIKQSYFFEATPLEIYELLMDEQKHSAFTGAEAKIQKHVGTEFSAWDGYIQGKNIDLEPAQRIVQTWRSNEEGWPAKHFSEVTITLKAKNDGCELTLIQTEVPEACYETINQGWIDYYWEPMEAYLEG
jgi:activator of HSP90 ATPase